MPALRRIVLILLVAVAGLFAGLWFARQQAPVPLVLEHATLFPAPRALPDFALLDQAGRPFGPGRLAGRWSILFFGFTQCPDVCPSTLAALAAARRELADLPPAQQPQVILVSVDPARDTPERLAGYVRFFDESFTGVTGEPAALETLTRELGVAVLVGKPDDAGRYTIDHTATLFLVNPDGALAAVFGTPHSPDGIAHDYRLILERTAGDAS
jgi:protein SCO1/2